MKFNEQDSIELFKDEVIYRKYKSGIYFLVDDLNEVVYVGRANNLDKRPYEHRDKKFSRMYAIPIHKDDLAEFEFMYISKYLPYYNRTFPRCQEYYALADLKKYVHTSMPNKKCMDIFDKKKIPYLSIKLPRAKNPICFIHQSQVFRAENAIRPSKVSLNIIYADTKRCNKIFLNPQILNNLGISVGEPLKLSCVDNKIIIERSVFDGSENKL